MKHAAAGLGAHAIVMSRDEMRIVRNCINEALETSVDGRLPTVGADKAYVAALWERLNLVDDDDGHVAVSLSPEELRVLSGCVATAIDVVAGWERPIRVGATNEEIGAVAQELSDLIAAPPPL